MDKEKIIKKTLQNYRARNIPVKAFWDAGGDSRSCHIQFGEESEVISKGVNIGSELIYRIIDVLDLPHTGDDFNHGSGIIDINDKEEVSICYSAIYKSYIKSIYDHSYYDILNDDVIEYEDQYPEIEKLSSLSFTTGLDDPMRLYCLLARADVNLLGRINLNLETENDLVIKIQEGDEFLFKEEELQPYFTFVNDCLLHHLDEMLQLEAPLRDNPLYIPFESIIFKGTFLPNNQIKYEIMPSGDHFKSFKNVTVILFE